jgi:hypothetical protein
MGSGTTGVACMNTNRNFIGMEMDENYYKIAEERIKNAVPVEEAAQDPSTPCWMPYTNKVINETPQMSTRSRIGIELSDGSVLSAYHHWDGYPEWLGRILNTHYNAKSLAEELIDGGDMSPAWTDERCWDLRNFLWVSMVPNTTPSVAKNALLV